MLQSHVVRLLPELVAHRHQAGAQARGVAAAHHPTRLPSEGLLHVELTLDNQAVVSEEGNLPPIVVSSVKRRRLPNLPLLQALGDLLPVQVFVARSRHVLVD